MIGSFLSVLCVGCVFPLSFYASLDSIGSFGFENVICLSSRAMPSLLPCIIVQSLSSYGNHWHIDFV